MAQAGTDTKIISTDDPLATELTENQIIIIAPHPDDELIGCWSVINHPTIRPIIIYTSHITEERKAEALKLKDNEIVYFLENDYLHKPNSQKIIREGLKTGAAFVSLYDHPDKYLSPENGGNPYCAGGAEDTRVYLTESTHWKITNSTTMTFAAKVSTLRENEKILRKHTSTTHPNDFGMFMELRESNKLLITPLPGYATHGETAWLSPLTDWSKI